MTKIYNLPSHMLIFAKKKKSIQPSIPIIHKHIHCIAKVALSFLKPKLGVMYSSTNRCFVKGSTEVITSSDYYPFHLLCNRQLYIRWKHKFVDIIVYIVFISCSTCHKIPHFPLLII